MCEEEIIKRIEKINQDYKLYNPIDKIELEAIQGLLDLYNQEKEKNKAIEIYRKDMPDDTKLIIMRKDDFDRNFGSDYISKDKIREIAEDYESKGYIEIAGAMRELLEERN